MKKIVTLSIILTASIFLFVGFASADELQEIQSDDDGPAGSSNLYIGSSRTDVNQQELKKVLEEVNGRERGELPITFIVAAPNDPQPSSEAFALRLRQKRGKKVAVLVFPPDGELISELYQDSSTSLDDKINTYARNNDCALDKARKEKTAGQAVITFADHLEQGCSSPYTSNLLRLLAGLTLVFTLFFGVLAKEKEGKFSEELQDLPPPQEKDFVRS